MNFPIYVYIIDYYRFIIGFKDWIKFKLKKLKEDEDEIFGDGAYIPFPDENLITDQMRVKFYNEFMAENKKLYEIDAIRYWMLARNYVEMKMIDFKKQYNKA